jgi:uncharacterized protein (TIGR03437 family)
MNFISILAAGLLASAVAAGQAFQGLSTTDDGSVLYFSTPDRVVGSSQSFHSKIFRWDAVNGFQLIADVADTGASYGCTTANFYQLSSPQVSGDGTILAYTGSRPEAGGRFCAPSEPNQGIVQQNGADRILTGSIALSFNGLYAITTPADAVANGYHYVTDLQSGSPVIVSGAFNGDRRRITDEGAVLSAEPSALVLTDRFGGSKVWQTQMAVSDAIVDRGGDTLVYLTALAPNNPGAISTIDVATGMETEIFTGFAPGNLYFTADGSHLLFTNYIGNGTFPFLMSVDGSGQRQIGTVPVSDAILSGDGTVIYANSADGGLTRIDVASGDATELAPDTPIVIAAYDPYPPATTIAPVGAVITLYGPEPADVKQVTFCGQPVATMVGQFEQFLQFQVPWNLPNQTCDAIVQTASPFEAAISLTVQQYDPQFVTDGNGSALLYHGNFSGPVDSGSPPQTGEVIVAYMTGLGPVDSHDLLTKPGFACEFNSAQATVTYAGLAPGLLGFYQVNIRVPDLSQTSGTLTCGWDISTEGTASFQW